MFSNHHRNESGSSQPTPIILTVPVFAIESAPKDRDIMLFFGKCWHRSYWWPQYTCWATRVGTAPFDNPTHWCEVESMQIPREGQE